MTAVGVLTGHGELLTPRQAGFSRFLAMLTADGAKVEALERPRFPAELRGFDALVLGAPGALLAQDELDVLAAAVHGGARLLLLATAGGDSRPFGDPARRTNLSALFPGLTFHDNALYFSTSMEGDDNMVLRIPAAPLPGLPPHAHLDYVAGCTFQVEEPLTVLASASAHEDLEDIAACFDLVVDNPYTLTGGHPDSVRQPEGLVFAHLAYGRGQVLVLGGCNSLRDEYLSPGFASWLLERLLALDPGAELARRMRGPQRHRLLQGYPMAPLMEPTAGKQTPWLSPWNAPPDPMTGTRPGKARSLLVGVLPHPYCNPTVEGCGFCTFPQEKLERSRLPALARAVIEEIDAFAAQEQNRPAVTGLYFGGATANLTPIEEFEALSARLDTVFDLRDAEITLEGVPRYFQIKDYALMRTLQARFPRSTLRISMGVQTLDEQRLAAMGRAGFGDAATFAAVVEQAHALGFSASCDLLINLPGQTLEQMQADIEGVAAMGFDQVCVYHLVLFEGLGTPWARSPELLQGLPSNGEAFDRWLRCAELLRERGYTQTTLTNFERPGRPGFRYEPLGFQPDRHDLVGFGPAAISLWSTPDFRTAVKTLNPTLAGQYTAPERPERRFFRYNTRDLQVLFLTRSIARLSIDTDRYQALFGTRVETDFPRELEALRARHLLQDLSGSLALTSEGMFYADAVAGLLAWRRVQEVRAEQWKTQPHQPQPPEVDKLKLRDPNLSDYGSMG